jgi:hypothetical protein
MQNLVNLKRIKPLGIPSANKPLGLKKIQGLS